MLQVLLCAMLVLSARAELLWKCCRQCPEKYYPLLDAPFNVDDTENLFGEGSPPPLKDQAASMNPDAPFTCCPTCQFPSSFKSFSLIELAQKTKGSIPCCNYCREDVYKTSLSSAAELFSSSPPRRMLLSAEKRDRFNPLTALAGAAIKVLGSAPTAGGISKSCCHQCPRASSTDKSISANNDGGLLGSLLGK